MGACAPDADNSPPHAQQASSPVVQYDSLLALVVVTESAACMTTAPGVSPPEHVTIIGLHEGRVTSAAVTGISEPCPGDVSGLPGVALRLSSSDLSAGELGVAVLRSSPAVVGSRIDVDGDGSLESFAQCTSAEGVHVTAWAGEPLTGRRIWYAYHYLGYDVEPTCSEAETGGS